MPILRTMAFDHEPYSNNATGLPNDIAEAQRQGAATWLDDVDFRQIEWMDASMDVTRRAALRVENPWRVGDFRA